MAKTYDVSEEFIRYQEEIATSPVYAGMPDLRNEDGSIQWEAPSNRGSGIHKDTHDKRLQWWREKAESVGISTTENQWISKTAKRIHPTKTKPCKFCGRIMDIRYCYLSSTLINRIRLRGYDIQALGLTETTSIFELIPAMYDMYGESVFDFFPALLRCKAVPDIEGIAPSVAAWIDWIERECQMHIINTETEASARQKHQVIQKWLLENTPTRLYRYFSNAERNIDAFANNEVWGSRIDTFNDPYECVPCFDVQWLLDAIDNDVLTQQSKQIISQIQSNDFNMNAASLTSTEDLQRLADNMQQYSEEQIMQVLTFAEKQLKGYIGDHVYEFMSEAYAQIHVAELYRHIACFTENMDSTLMWGHYASSHQGFCAEYDFSSVLEPCAENCSDIRRCSNFMFNHSIAPVYYSKGRVDATYR